MGKVLQFRSRKQEAEKLVDEVKAAVNSFNGDKNERKQFVNYVIRRCDRLKLGNDDPVIAQLDKMLDGFMD